MSKDFEEQLRGALRPVDPDDGFADRVMARVQREPAHQPSRKYRWAAAALAASVVTGVIMVHDLQSRREREGLEARKQLIEALRVTGEKLDIAYQAINRESSTESAAGSGV